MKNVVAIFDTVDGIRPNASAYVRLILPLTKDTFAHSFTVTFSKVESVDLYDPSVIITQRTATDNDDETDFLIRFCKEREIKLVFDIDDDLLCLPDDHPDYRFFARRNNLIRRLAAAADEVWTSTPTLADRLSQLGKNVIVIRNCLDGRLWRPKVRSEKYYGPIRCLYMGGSSHHLDFVNIIEPAISRLRNVYGEDIQFDLVGPLSEAQHGAFWRILQPPPNIANCYPAFVTWLQNLPPYDLGVAPLRNHYFNYAKSEIKWLEYSALSIATVASNLPPYQDAFQHRKTGLLVPSDWNGFFAGMQELIDDRDMLHAIGRAACNQVIDMMAAQRQRDRRFERLLALTSSD